MTYLQLVFLHLGTVLPAFFIGTYLMLSRKGSPVHRLLGKVYMGLMMITAVVTLFMKAEVGPVLANHFGFIHLFSLMVLILVPRAYQAARGGRIRAHQASMIGIYIGGMLIAGGLALAPGRLLHDWVFA